MKMPLVLLEQRFANPMQFKKLIQNYLNENKLKIDQSKSIGSIVLYDQQPCVGVTAVTLFQGVPNAARTNMQNNFVRNQSEHVILTSLRVCDGAAAVLNATDWNIGVADAATKNGLISIQVNGVVYMNRVPLTEFNPDLTDESQGRFDLPEPILWPAQTEIKVSLEWATAPAVANSNIRVELEGIGLLS